MGNIIRLTESQMKKLTERRINEYSANEIVNILHQIECTGESIKTLVSRKLSELGFEDIIIKFLGYGDKTDDLQYIVYTEGPVFVITAQSRSEMEPPCMDIVSVVSYVKS
jgi:hypothetical protein